MTTLQLKELSHSGLYRRRRDRPDSLGLQELPEQKLSNMANALANAMCERCRGGFAPAEKIVNSNGELYHEQCFVCAQCFQQFPEGLFYEFEGRKYCEHDFQMLFAPCCHQCGEFIIGRVIKAMNNSWHPECFCCDICQQVLADIGFVKNAGRICVGHQFPSSLIQGATCHCKALHGLGLGYLKDRLFSLRST